ncbi:MAG: acyltransferase family protein [Cohaesibacter sp.]|jgi:uncharacterized membrane protein YcfT|nr:acyltransferase family protein [Cohaesibacter sp.]
MAKKPQRIEWVDKAKGLTILLVVMLHSTAGVEKQFGMEGWMHAFITFAEPFRMPVFFAIAGLFAAKAMTQDWRSFFDSKFAHFFYFYILWLTINFIFKGPYFAQTLGIEGTILAYFTAFIEPFGLLWFIYLLPIFFLVLRLTYKAPVLGQIILALCLKIALQDAENFILNRFADYYLFFLIGYFGREFWFRLAHSAKEHPISVISGLVVWALINGLMVTMGFHLSTPMAAILGLSGILAVVSLMAIMPNKGIGALFNYCGTHSLPIYLGFFLPMVITRISFASLCAMCGTGLASLVVFLVAVSGAVLMYELVKLTKIGTFLYARPHWAHIKPHKSHTTAPAE